MLLMIGLDNVNLVSPASDTQIMPANANLANKLDKTMHNARCSMHNAGFCWEYECTFLMWVLGGEGGRFSGE